jgi:hypothetical protein
MATWEYEMAHQNQHADKQAAERSIEEATRKMGEQTNRATGAAVDVAERAAHANAQLLQNGMETAHQLWRCSADLTSSFAHRSAEQFGRTLGVGGKEAEASTERSSYAVTAIVQSSQSLNDGYRKVSEEWFKLARTQMERAFEHFDRALRSRSPQELAEAFRDQLEGLITIHPTDRSSIAANGR